VNLDNLPEEIVQPLLQLGRAAYSCASTSGYQLAQHEGGVRAAWRRVAPLLLEGVLQLATTGLDETARPLASHLSRL
jgi:hypothetical protein